MNSLVKDKRTNPYIVQEQKSSPICLSCMSLVTKSESIAAPEALTAFIHEGTHTHTHTRVRRKRLNTDKYTKNLQNSFHQSAHATGLILSNF